jgi:hypothetical protein
MPSGLEARSLAMRAEHTFHVLRKIPERKKWANSRYYAYIRKIYLRSEHFI